MCGICGIVHLKDGPPPDAALVRRMMGRLRHRGPDGSGYYRDRRIVMGHTRLAIIDVDGGSQPMCNEDGTLWISYNGEVYNHPDLAERLAACGHRFRTRSDTEVVLHAYEEWGTDCFERLDGQWALALWDSRRQALVLSRDRLGVRPLYYTESQGRFLFASEVKALFAAAELDRELDPEGLAETLTFWCPVAPRTSFRGIRQLRPGHTMRVEDGKLIEQPHWTISFPHSGEEPSQDESENASHLRRALADASRERFLRSDVPVGGYLSGGLDSSVICALVSDVSPASLQTYGIRFADEEYDEGEHQQVVAARLGVQHHETLVKAEDIAQVFSEVVWHAEQPLLRAAPAPLYLLSRTVRQSGIKVVVTGEGADEVLGGYDIYREALARLFVARDPSSSRRAAIYDTLYPWMSRSPASTGAFAREFFARGGQADDPAFSHRPRWMTTWALRGLLSPQLRADVEKTRVVEELLARMPPGHMHWHPLCRAQWLEMVTLLPGYILSAQGDRMLMAHAVEGRFPYLDTDVVAAAGFLPARHKILGLREKHLLRVACADLVPERTLQRPKQPYRAPDASSFFGGSRPEWVRELLDPVAVRRAGVLDAKAVQRLVEKCRSVGGQGMGNTDNMRVLMAISLSLIQRQYVEQDGRSGSDEMLPTPLKVVDRAWAR